MTRSDAIQFQETIEKLCEQNDVWCSVTRDKKPDIKLIKIEMCIRIDPTTAERG